MKKYGNKNDAGKVNPRRLHEFEEGSGLLHQVTELEGFPVAVFSWGAIIFPSELEARLRELIGRKITALRLDGRYYIREISE